MTCIRLAAVLLLLVASMTLATCQKSNSTTSPVNGSTLVAAMQQLLPNNGNANETIKQQGTGSAVTMFKEPNSWLITILREFFSDIDWKKILLAREQVEKFVRRMDKLMSVFRPPKKVAEEVKQQQQDSGFRLWSSNLWNSSSTSSKLDSPKLDSPKLDDPSNVKEMLQRVACFLGYMRILNNSQQALAELDSAKLISNLFSGSKSSSFWSSWFG